MAARRRALAREPDPARRRSSSTRASWPADSSCASTRRARSPRARLRPGEADEIRGRLEAAQHGEAIARGGATARARRSPARRAAPGSGSRSRVREARDLARLDPRFEPLAERLAGLEAELVDVAETVRELAESVDHDPAELAGSRERLSPIYALSDATATTRPR